MAEKSVCVCVCVYYSCWGVFNVRVLYRKIGLLQTIIQLVCLKGFFSLLMVASGRDCIFPPHVHKRRKKNSGRRRRRRDSSSSSRLSSCSVILSAVFGALFFEFLCGVGQYSSIKKRELFSEYKRNMAAYVSVFQQGL